MLDFSRGAFAWNTTTNNFTWEGYHFRHRDLLDNLRIPAQPIPEGLLQEPVELPLGESALSDMTLEVLQTRYIDPTLIAPALSDVALEEAAPTMFVHPAESDPTTSGAEILDTIDQARAELRKHCGLHFESDPNGLDPHAPGAKLDAGKNRLGLVLGGFANALSHVGLVGTGGAVTYSDNGWKKVEDGIARYEDAMLRHWIEIQRGNVQDPKTGLLHQAHLTWNALAVLELMLARVK